MTLTLAIEPSNLKLFDIIILHICGKFNQNQFINDGARVMTMFLENSHCDLDLGHGTLKLEFV